VNSVFFVIFFW